MTTPHDQAHLDRRRRRWIQRLLWWLATLLLAFLAWGFVWEPAQLVERDYAIDAAALVAAMRRPARRPRRGPAHRFAAQWSRQARSRGPAADRQRQRRGAAGRRLRDPEGAARPLRRTGSRGRAPQAADRAQAGVRGARQPRLVEERRQGPARAGIGRRGGAGEPRPEGDAGPVPAVAGRASATCGKAIRTSRAHSRMCASTTRR